MRGKEEKVEWRGGGVRGERSCEGEEGKEERAERSHVDRESGSRIAASRETI